MARVPIPSLKGKLKAGSKVPSKPKPPKRKPKKPKLPVEDVANARAGDIRRQRVDDFARATHQMHESLLEDQFINPNQLENHKATFKSLPPDVQKVVLEDPITGPRVMKVFGVNNADEVFQAVEQPTQGISKGTERRAEMIARGEEMPATGGDVTALNQSINELIQEGKLNDKTVARSFFKDLGKKGFDVEENMKKLGDKTTPWSPQDIVLVGLGEGSAGSGRWMDSVDAIRDAEPVQAGFKKREKRKKTMQEEGYENFRGGLVTRDRLEKRVETGAETGKTQQIPDTPFDQRRKILTRETGILQKPAKSAGIVSEADAIESGLAMGGSGSKKGLSGGRGPTDARTIGGLQDLLTEQPEGMFTARGVPSGPSLFADMKASLWKDLDEFAEQTVKNSGAYTPGSASEAMAIESIKRAGEYMYGPHPELAPNPDFIPDRQILDNPEVKAELQEAQVLADAIPALDEAPAAAAPAAGVPAMSGNPAAATGMPKPPPPTSVRKAQSNALGKKGPKAPPPTTPGGTPKVKTNKVVTAPGVPNPTQKKLTPKQLKAMQKKNAAYKAALPKKNAPPPKPAPGKAASGVPPQTGTTPSTTAAQPAATKPKSTKPKSTKPKANTAKPNQAPPPNAAPTGKGKGKKGKGKKQSGYVDDDPTGTKAFDALEEANRKTDELEATRNKRNKYIARAALTGIAGYGVGEALKPGPAPEMNTADLPGSEAGAIRRGGPSDGRPEFDESKANRDAMDAAEVLERLRRQRRESQVGSGNRPMYQVPGNMIGRLKGRI